MGRPEDFYPHPSEAATPYRKVKETGSAPSRIRAERSECQVIDFVAARRRLCNHASGT